MIFYINGTSSSGKTTLARELQGAIPQPVIYFSTDALIYSLSPQIIEGIQGKRKFEVSVDWNTIFKGYFECVAALSLAKNVVIADCPIYTEGTFKLFQESLQKIPQKVLIGLKCPLEVLVEREKNRKDRDPGLAESQFKDIHTFIKYDLMVDSHSHNPAEIVKLILNMDAQAISR